MSSINDEFNYIIINNQFPRIGKGLEIRWGTADFEPYVNDLLNDTKGHTRQGFPKDVGAALQSLLLLHHRLFPSKRIKDADLWNSSFGDLDY